MSETAGTVWIRSTGSWNIVSSETGEIVDENGAEVRLSSFWKNRRDEGLVEVLPAPPPDTEKQAETPKDKAARGAQNKGA